MGAELDSFSDEELLKKYQDLGDVQALNLLFERYLSFAFSCFSKLLNDKATCDDLTQNVFLKIAIKIDSGEEIANFRNYLKVSIKNMFRDYLRKKKSGIIWLDTNNSSNGTTNNNHVNGDDSQAEPQLDEEKVLAVIEECLQLFPDERERNILRDNLLGYSLKEIAERNNCNPNTAASIWHRKKKILIKCLINKV